MRRPATQSNPAPTRASAPVTARPGFAVWLMAAWLALVTVALYWPVTAHDFVNFDDGPYVYQNAHVRSGLNWESLQWAFTNLDIGLWHPLTWVSHMLDCQWFGLRPGWHHLTSLLFHTANTLLLFGLLRRLTGALWRSAFVAALFALHPLHVESVAWVSERKDVLSTFFFMLTLWAYVRYSEGRRKREEYRMQNAETGIQNEESSITHHASRITHHASIFYLLSVGFFACGLMSKPMLVTLPFVLLLLDYWPLKRWEPAVWVSGPWLAARLLVEKLPFVLAALLTSLITLHGGHRYGSLPSVAACPLTARLANATLSYARYFLQAFWPGDLAVYYPFPAAFSVWGVGGAALLLLGISVAAFCLARRRPYVVVGWLWYLATLLPVIGLIQLGGYSHADRYTYVPLIGVFVALVWGAHDLTERWRYGVMAVWVAGGAAMGLCLVLTRQQLGYWKDSETLFRHALAVTENNYLAHNNLGIALYKKGQMDEAIRQLQETLPLKPDFAEAHYNLGITLVMIGQIDKAISQYQEAIRLKPNYAEAHNNLGIALAKKGQINEAIRRYQEALHLKPDYAEAHNNLGNALGEKGQIGEAIRQYQEALRLDPDYADAHYDLGAALGEKGRTDEAIHQYQEALRLKPDFAEAHNNLGIALAEKGQIDGAIRQYREALRLKPDYAEAHINLGAALATKGQIDEAIRHFREALRLKPDYAEARDNLARALEMKNAPAGR